MLKINGLKKSFGSNIVLDNLSFNVEKGDVIAIMGPSGCGKTTLLRCLDFLEKADEGILTLDNQVIDLTNADKKQIYRIRRRVGFVFQDMNLFINKTALGNVMEGLVTARKIQKKEAAALSKTALDKVGLSDRYDYYPNQLSVGQQQRVAIARAIAVKPDIILFDEPTSALDPELVSEVQGKIKMLAGEKVTMLVVTHDVSFARDVANKVIFIENGKIIEEGPSADFFSNPKEEKTQQFLSKVK